MIGKNWFKPSVVQISAPLLGLTAITLAHVVAAAPLDTTAQALDLITNTADRICNVVSTKGEAESSEVKGQLKAKLADVGVTGSGSIDNEQYQNVLRRDLASTLQDSAECKLKACLSG
jgi:hypothetical protein